MTRPGSEVERGRRLAEVWRASAPSNEEIERLRARIAARPARRRRSRTKMLVVALVQGFMLGGATLATAAWIAGRTAPLFEPETVQSSEKHEALAAKERHRGRPPRASRLDEEVSGEVPHAAFGEVGNGAAATAGFPAGSPDREGRTMRTEPTKAVAARPATAHERAHATPEREGARERTQAQPESVAAGPDEDAEPAPIAPDGPWGRVARALSAGDWQRADAALVELARVADPATRDAADLARAELWIAHGRGGAFRANVERLARAGYTPLIRKRALRLLDRLP
jgi:hypothetical protein